MDSLAQVIPEFQDSSLLAYIAKTSTVKEFGAGTLIMDIGGYIKNIPILLSGTIKVLREDEEGAELLLYYLHPGQTCSMTLTCCQAVAKSKVRAIAEEDVVLLLVPVERMSELTSDFKPWMQFILRSHTERFDELLHTLDSIAFQQMDQRLLGYLTEKQRIVRQPVLRITHQEIAIDLHSSREVISRLLKQLEKMGKVKLTRGSIEILPI